MEGVLQLGIDAILVVAFIGVAVGWFVSQNAGLRRAFAAATILLLIALVGALSVVIVPAGNVAVVTAFGEVQNETLPPGLHFRAPFINAVHLIQTRVQPHNFQAIDAATQENLTVKVTGTMNYHVDGAFAAELYQRVGDDFASKVIDPAFSDYIKQIIPSFSASSEAENFILNKREDIRSLTKTQLGDNLARYHIIVDDIYIVDIAYPPEYDAAITAKQVAQQQVQTESQVLAQRQIQAQQAVAVAKGQADAQVTLAQGQAKANDLINASLTPEVIQYIAITKLNPTVTTILLPTGTNFLLPASLFEQKPQ